MEGHGAWLPGDGARGGAGVGLGAGYGFASAGVEVWRYTLTLEDSLNDNRTRIDSTLIVPLRVGIRFQPVDAPLVVGAAGGVGLLLVAPEDTQDVGRCTSIQYGGAAGLLRAFVGWDAGLLIVATHLGVTKNLSKAAVDSCGIYFNPGAEPYRRDLPDELPFGIQLGLSVTLSYP